MHISRTWIFQHLSNHFLKGQVSRNQIEVCFIANRGRVKSFILPDNAENENNAKNGINVGNVLKIS